MANVTHSNMTGAELHEPKGAATASSGTVYRSNGVGSGNWVTPGGAEYGFMSLTDNVLPTNLPAGAPGAYVTIAPVAWVLHHQDGGYTLTAGSNGLIVPTTGDYKFNAVITANTNGTDKYDVKFDFGTQVAAAGAITQIGHGAPIRYLDKLKTGVASHQTVASMTAGDAVYLQARLELTDAGAAAPNLYTSQVSVLVELMHEAV